MMVGGARVGGGDRHLPLVRAAQLRAPTFRLYLTACFSPYLQITISEYGAERFQRSDFFLVVEAYLSDACTRRAVSSRHSSKLRKMGQRPRQRRKRRLQAKKAKEKEEAEQAKEEDKGKDKAPDQEANGTSRNVTNK
ncbi:hypothetical protein ZWY2020_060047 [Hordeum vulgare]|nr:hypothetical protein ZWY2020_060047 [Hordeum vulgare]